MNKRSTNMTKKTLRLIGVGVTLGFISLSVMSSGIVSALCDFAAFITVLSAVFIERRTATAHK